MTSTGFLPKFLNFNQNIEQRNDDNINFLYILIVLIYRTRAIITRGYYFFSLFCDVGFSLMFGGIPLKLRGY